SGIPTAAVGREGRLSLCRPDARRQCKFGYTAASGEEPRHAALGRRAFTRIKEDYRLRKPVLLSLGSLLRLGGCAQPAAWTSTTPTQDDATTAEGAGEKANHLYVTADAPVDVANFRNIYIAPANLANMQVIQPEGSATDGEWWVTDEENEILQRAIAFEY